MSKVKAEIPQAFLEYVAHYQRPCFSAWAAQDKLLSELYESLKPWDLELRDIAQAPGNNFEETHILFNLSRLGITLKLSFGQFKFTVVNPDWSRSDQILKAFESASKAIRRTVGVVIESQNSVLAMHVTLAGEQKDAINRIADFGKVKNEDEVIALAAGIYRKNSSVVVDRSVALPGALFVRLERAFGSSTSFQEIADSIRVDEKEILELLGLEVEGL